MMAKELSLTPEQKTKILAIEKENMEQMEKLRAENQGENMEKMRAEMMKSRTAVDAKINAVLTDAQKPKYEEMKKRMIQQRPGGQQGGFQGNQGFRPNPEERNQRLNQRIEMMAKELSLTPEQKEKVLGIEKGVVEQENKLRNDNQGGGDREKMIADMRKLRNDADAKIKALLTDVQKPKYEELKIKMAQQRAGGQQGRPQGGTGGRQGTQPQRPQGRP
jgi:Spy/CpxP family protein refolding chaperone